MSINFLVTVSSLIFYFLSRQALCSASNAEISPRANFSTGFQRQLLHILKVLCSAGSWKRRRYNRADFEISDLGLCFTMLDYYKEETNTPELILWDVSHALLGQRSIIQASFNLGSIILAYLMVESKTPSP